MANMVLHPMLLHRTRIPSIKLTSLASVVGRRGILIIGTPSVAAELIDGLRVVVVICLLQVVAFIVVAQFWTTV